MACHSVRGPSLYAQGVNREFDDRKHPRDRRNGKFAAKPAPPRAAPADVDVDTMKTTPVSLPTGGLLADPLVEEVEAPRESWDAFAAAHATIFGNQPEFELPDYMQEPPGEFGDVESAEDAERIYDYAQALDELRYATDVDDDATAHVLEMRPLHDYVAEVELEVADAG